MIPGSNLLNQALGVIARQTVTYYQDAGRTVSSVLLYDTEYADGVDITGSFQPVDNALYQQLGLDLSKTYWTLYTSNNIVSVNRDVSGDQIAFNGRRFQCESATDWFMIDGWKSVLCVLIGAEPSAASRRRAPPLHLSARAHV